MFLGKTDEISFICKHTGWNTRQPGRQNSTRTPLNHTPRWWRHWCTKAISQLTN